MEVGGQLHAPAALIPRKGPPCTHWTGSYRGRAKRSLKYATKNAVAVMLYNKTEVFLVIFLHFFLIVAVRNIHHCGPTNKKNLLSSVGTPHPHFIPKVLLRRTINKGCWERHRERQQS
jgi:hypothetical protein